MINAFSGISARQSYGISGGGGGDGVSLLDWGDFTYEGSFRPANSGYSAGGASLASGGGRLFYNSANNSLFVADAINYLGFLEVGIPETLTDGNAVGSTSDLATATVTQGRRITTGDIPNYTLEGTIRLGGMWIDSGKLYCGIYEYYDGDGDGYNDVFVLDNAATLSSANITGLFKMGATLGGGYTSGYFADIPSAKQAKLGGYTHFCGNNGLAITGRSSQGPVFVAINIADIGVTNPTSAGYYLYYNEANKLGWNSDAIWNPVSYAWGAFIPNGTNCVIFVGKNAVEGSKGYVEVQYGTGAETGDPCDISKGYHSVNGDYGGYYWAYDLDDLEAVKNGALAPYAVAPYAHGEITYPFPACRRDLFGIAHDRANRKIYSCERGAHINGFDNLPVFHCWSY